MGDFPLEVGLISIAVFVGVTMEAFFFLLDSTLGMVHACVDFVDRGVDVDVCYRRVFM